MIDDLIAQLEAAPDWMLAGMLVDSLLRIEAQYTFRTGDGNRVCRHEKAVQARNAIDRITALCAKEAE